MVKKYFIICFLSLLTQGLMAQNIDQFSISLNSEAIGLPFTNYAPIHPGAELSGTFRTIEKDKSFRYLNLKAGFFYHRRLETAIYLGGEYQYSHRLLQDKLSLDVPVGLGYLHSFYPGELYEQNSEGGFEVVNQFGRPHLYLNLGAGFTNTGSD